MGIATDEAIVKNGQIRLPVDVRLPEHARVYVVVPGVEIAPAAQVASPRLVHPEQAVDFNLEVVEEGGDATV